MYDYLTFEEDKPEVKLRKFSLDEILDVEKEDEQVINSLNNSDLYNSLLYYTDKDELIQRMQSHAIDILITDNPSVHNLNILDELMQLRSTIIIFDTANEIEVERRKETYYHKIEPFLRRNRYELYKESELSGVKIYEWNRGIEQKFTDTVIEGLTVDQVAMLMSAMFTENDTVLLDTYALPELMHFGAVYKRNVITAVKFDKQLVTYLESYLDKKQSSVQEPKVSIETGQYELTF
jgi:hypothetical protein